AARARRWRGASAAGASPARTVAAHARAPHRRDRAASVKIEGVADRCQDILAALAEVIVGKTGVLEQILAGVLANGHILIEDYPGLAKTLIARLVAGTLDLSFKRIQFTPDLLHSDITGSFLFDQRHARLQFRPGP